MWIAVAVMGEASGHGNFAAALAAFALTAQISVDLAGRKMDGCDLLEEAWRDYDRAARGLLVSDGRAAQRIATLHWVLVQAESLSAVLGRPRDPGRWETASPFLDRRALVLAPPAVLPAS